MSVDLKKWSYLIQKRIDRALLIITSDYSEKIIQIQPRNTGELNRKTQEGTNNRNGVIEINLSYAKNQYEKGKQGLNPLATNLWDINVNAVYKDYFKNQFVKIMEGE